MAAFEKEILTNEEKNFGATILRVEHEAANGKLVPASNKKLDKRINKHRELKMLNDRASLASSLSHAETLNGTLSGHEDNNESKRLLPDLSETMVVPGGKQNGGLLCPNVEPIVVTETKQKDVCLIQESPFYIHKIAQTERLDEFKRLFEQDPTRLLLKDNAKSWLPIQYAVFKNKVKVIDFIIDNSEAGKNETDMSWGFFLDRTILYCIRIRYLEGYGYSTVRLQYGTVKVAAVRVQALLVLKV